MQALQKNLKTAIFKVMEMMYFLLPDEKPNNENHVYIGITGEPGYLISIVFHDRLASKMAIDLLGIDESEINADVLSQTLHETANIIGGNFLHSFDTEENRNLTLPGDEKKNVFGKFEVLDSDQFIVSFEGEPVNVMIETVRLPS